MNRQRKIQKQKSGHKKNIHFDWKNKENIIKLFSFGAKKGFSFADIIYKKLKLHC